MSTIVDVRSLKDKVRGMRNPFINMRYYGGLAQRD